MRLCSLDTIGSRRIRMMPRARPGLRMRAGRVFAVLSVVSLVGAPAAALARRTEGATPPHTELILLGTAGGPIISPRRKARSQPASLVKVGSEVFLIDAGAGVVRELAAAGMASNEVQYVFITHLHWDHEGGLASLFQFDWIGHGRSMNVYGPPGTGSVVRRAIAFGAISDTIEAAELPSRPPVSQLIHAHEVRVADTPHVIFQDHLVRVLAAENTHYSMLRLAHQPYGSLRSYAYRFDTPDRSIVFTGDTGPSRAVARLAKGADILVSEVISRTLQIAYARRIEGPRANLAPLIAHIEHEHMTPEEVGKMAARAGVKVVVLTHFIPGMDKEDPGTYTKGVRKYFSGPVVAGKDGEVL